jgi:glycerophosphoryl diester phosphodiesterase
MPLRTQVFAHRGARAVAPENTLPAFARALELGADGIELDVQCSADGHLVVMHDFAVDKTTDGTGPVAALTLAELRRLDAGRAFGPAFAGVRVPTLEEVLDLIGNRCRLNIEIKSMDVQGGAEADAVVALVQLRNLFDQVIVSSFNPITLIKLRWLEPKLALGLLYEEDLPPYLRAAWLSPMLAPQALHPYHRLVDAGMVQWAKGRGLAINTWTVNDEEEARRLVALGVDAIITDVPDVIQAALAEMLRT